MVLRAAAHRVSDVRASALHGLGEHADGFLFQDAQRDLGAVEVLVALCVDDADGGEVDPRFEGGAQAHARQRVPLGLVGEQLDGASLVSHRDDELVVHH